MDNFWIILTVLAINTNSIKGDYNIDGNMSYATDFSKLKCQFKRSICHIYSRDIFGPKCSGGAVVMGLSTSEISLMLNAYNSIRNKIAGGISGRKDLQGITAANMYALSYSRELEYSAGCWARQCILSHSRCRMIGDGQVGETIFFQKVNAIDEPSLSKAPMKILLDSPTVFLRSFPRFTKHIIDNLELPRTGDDERNRETVQLMWALTRYIGCYRVSFPYFEAHHINLLYVCHYFPMGNIEDSPIFLRGQPASKCSGNVTRNDKYPNLCGNIRALEDDAWTGTLKGERCTFDNILLFIVILYNIGWIIDFKI